MIVAVTGGTGRVGQAAVARLVAHGHVVRVLGRRSKLDIPGASYHPCDITDYEVLLPILCGCEGVVHLAAIPNPALGPGHEVFNANCRGTYNVYEACAKQGIRRVVQASSINALGYFFGIRAFPLEYLPIDENHPTCTTDPYSFSKQIIEEIGAYYWRREGISGVSLRLPGVWAHDPKRGALRHARVRQSRDILQEFLNLPERARRTRLAEMSNEYAEARRQRIWEQVPDQRGPGSAARQIMAMRHNFWAWIDARDSAQAIEQGLLSDYTGSHVLFVNSDQNSAGVPSRELASALYPEVEIFRHTLPGMASLVSIERAQGLLGFQPEYRID